LISPSPLHAYLAPGVGFRRSFSASSQYTKENEQGVDIEQQNETEGGAMSRRLASMAEETLDTGSKSDRRLIQEAGFSEDLKKQLEDRIAQTAFAAENQRAMAEITMPVSIYSLPASMLTCGKSHTNNDHRLPQARARKT
jgi:short subunit dehydrogenase-like uncharacterized protein